MHFRFTMLVNLILHNHTCAAFTASREGTVDPDLVKRLNLVPYTDVAFDHFFEAVDTNHDGRYASSLWRAANPTPPLQTRAAVCGAGYTLTCTHNMYACGKGRFSRSEYLWFQYPDYSEAFRMRFTMQFMQQFDTDSSGALTLEEFQNGTMLIKSPDESPYSARSYDFRCVCVRVCVCACVRVCACVCARAYMFMRVCACKTLLLLLLSVP